MKNRIKLIVVSLGILSFFGCARIQETAKVMWGSSTRALEEARDHAKQAAFSCSMNECFDSVVDMAETDTPSKNWYEEDETQDMGILGMGNEQKPAQEDTEAGPAPEIQPALSTNTFKIFLKDRRKQHIVVIGVEGSIETTEVGIFFDSVSEHKVSIEVTSLSSYARDAVAEIVFSRLGQQYAKIP